MDSALSVLFAIGSMLGFGLADFVAKAVLTRANVYRTTLISQSIGTLPFLAVALTYDRAIPDQTFFLLAMASGALTALILFSFYKALSLGKATLVSPICSCMTVVAVVLSVPIFRETLSVTQILLIVAVFSGILLVAYQKSDGTGSSGSNTSILFALVVVFGGGGNAIVEKWIAMDSNSLAGYLIIRLSMLGVLGVLFPMLGSEVRIRRWPKGYATLAFLGVIDALAFFAVFMGYGTGFVSIVAPIANSSAAVTIILARIFLGERVLLHQRIGVVTIVAGVALLSAIS